MTAKDELRQRVEEMDEAEAARLLARLTPSYEESNGGSNGHGAIEGEEVDNPDWDAFVRAALATPPEERTPFQELALTPRPRSATRGGEDIDEITRRTLERIAHMPPTTADDPLWGLAGMIKRGPGESLTNVAENHDEYLAEAYADLHEDDDHP